MTGGREGRPARWARPFAYAFLAALITTSAAGVEQWPFTGWRLFSGVRTGVTAGWQVVTVDPVDDAETTVDFAALGRGFRGASWRLADFPAMTATGRDAVCRAWADAVTAATGEEIAAVRVYRTRRAVATDADRPSPAPSRTLRYECARR